VEFKIVKAEKPCSTLTNKIIQIPSLHMKGKEDRWGWDVRALLFFHFKYWESLRFGFHPLSDRASVRRSN